MTAVSEEGGCLASIGRDLASEADYIRIISAGSGD